MLRAMPPGAYLTIDPKQLVATVARVRARVEAEFPGAGLSKVAAALHDVSVDTIADSQKLGRPIRWLQGLVAVLLMGIPLTLIATVHESIEVGIATVVDLVTMREAGLGTLVFSWSRLPAHLRGAPAPASRAGGHPPVPLPGPHR